MAIKLSLGSLWTLSYHINSLSWSFCAVRKTNIAHMEWSQGKDLRLYGEIQMLGQPSVTLIFCPHPSYFISRYCLPAMTWAILSQGPRQALPEFLTYRNCEIQDDSYLNLLNYLQQYITRDQSLPFFSLLGEVFQSKLSYFLTMEHWENCLL